MGVSVAEEQHNGRELAYTPAEVARYTLEEIKRRRDNPAAGVPLGLSTVDRIMNPLRPGELVTILGRSSHYKSGLAQWWARWLAQSTLTDEQAGCVVYGTTEMAIEELGLYDMASTARVDAARVAHGDLTDDEWRALEGAAMRRAALPLWLLGHSLAMRKKRIRMTIRTIEKALYWIEDNMDFRARIVFLDYLNQLQPDRRQGDEGSRRVDVADIVLSAKDLALSMGCPVVMLAQCNRITDDRDWKIPTMRDAMETAAIEQYSDKMLSVWMPKVTENKGYIVEPNGNRLDVTDNLLLLGLIKQKNGPAGGYFKLYVDPTRNFIGPLETRETREWTN